MREAAAELSKQRQRVAKRLASETQKQLADLGMAEARLEAVLEPLPLGARAGLGTIAIRFVGLLALAVVVLTLMWSR